MIHVNIDSIDLPSRKSPPRPDRRRARSARRGRPQLGGLARGGAPRRRLADGDLSAFSRQGRSARLGRRRGLPRILRRAGSGWVRGPATVGDGRGLRRFRAGAPRHVPADVLAADRQARGLSGIAGSRGRGVRRAAPRRRVHCPPRSPPGRWCTALSISSSTASCPKRPRKSSRARSWRRRTARRTSVDSRRRSDSGARRLPRRPILRPLFSSPRSA